MYKVQATFNHRKGERGGRKWPALARKCHNIKYFSCILHAANAKKLLQSPQNASPLRQTPTFWLSAPRFYRRY